MDVVGIRELSHHTSRYIAQVKSGKTLSITEHGRVIATLSPAVTIEEPIRVRPRIGGYRSERPLTAEEIDVALAEGFGDSARR